MIDIIKQASSAVAMPVINSPDVHALKTTLSAWACKRLEAINDGVDLMSKLIDWTDDPVKLIEFTQDEWQDFLGVRIVDGEGRIHGFILQGSDVYIDSVVNSVKIGDIIEDLQSGIVYLSPNATEVERVLDFIDVCDELSVVQSQVMSYTQQLIDSTDDVGKCADVVLNAGMSSQNSTIRDLTVILSQNGGCNIYAITEVMKNMFSNVSTITEGHDSEDIGYQFNVDDYVAPMTMDVVTGMWTLIEPVLGAVASIATVCGQGIIGAIAMAGYGIVQAFSAMGKKFQEITNITFGSGTSDAYAVAVRGKIPTAAYTTKQSLASIHTPWGHIFSGAIESDGNGGHVHPLLIYPSCMKTLRTPFGYTAETFDKINYLEGTNHAPTYGNLWYNSTIYQNLSGDISIAQKYEGELPTENELDAISNVMMSTMNLAWYLALKMLGRSTIETLHPFGNFTPTVPNLWYSSMAGFMMYAPFATSFVPGYPVGADNIVHQMNIWKEQYGSAMDWWPSTREAQWNKINTLLSKAYDPDEVTQTGNVNDFSFFSLVNRCAWQITGSTSVNVWDQATVRNCLFREFILRANSMQPIDWAVDSYDNKTNIFGLDASYDDNPRIITDPYITPAAVSRRSLIIASAITIATTVAVVTASIIAVRTAKKMAMRKTLKKEQDAAKAEEDYKRDPSKINANKLIKAKRRFNRWANKTGYSSNSIGTFSGSSMAGLVPATSILEKLTASETSVDPNLEVILNVISGGSFLPD